MPTRRPRERPQHLSLDIVDTKGDADSIKVSASDHPSILAMFVWGPPRLFMINPAVDAKAGVWLYFPDATTQRMLLRPDVKGLRIGFSGIRSFARMLAKIAYCFAIERKYLRIDPNSEVVRCIMNDGYDYLPFIGGWISDQTKLSGVLHQVRFIKLTDRGTMYLVAEIRLFADLGTPLYDVVLASRPAL
jgi:hypothetical protein